MSLDAARNHMARGHSLKDTAKRLGMTAQELDLALWNELPDGKIKGGFQRSEKNRQCSSDRLKLVMADPVMKAQMMRGLARSRRRTRREIVSQAANLTPDEMAEVRRLNRSKRLLLDDAVQVVLRSRKPE
jgi:hypothetical protein